MTLSGYGVTTSAFLSSSRRCGRSWRSPDIDRDTGCRRRLLHSLMGLYIYLFITTKATANKCFLYAPFAMNMDRGNHCSPLSSRARWFSGRGDLLPQIKAPAAKGDSFSRAVHLVLLFPRDQ